MESEENREKHRKRNLEYYHQNKESEQFKMQKRAIARKSYHKKKLAATLVEPKIEFCDVSKI